MPGTKEYKTGLEMIYGKQGPPDDIHPTVNWLGDNKRVLDLLGRKIKEEDVAAKVGEIDKDLETDRKVLVFRDHLLNFPELNLRVSVIGPPRDTRGFPNLFMRAYCEPAKDLDDSDLVVFTGGPDVEPIYYDEEPHQTTAWDEDRDLADIAVYLHCLDEGIPMVGVCRGAQFLAVMNGAKLFQEINNHNGDHSIFDVLKKEHIPRISSVHHQCVRPCQGMEVIAYSHKADERWKNPEECVRGRHPEVEAFFFRDTCCFGVQGHPEYKDYNQYAKWFLDYINELVILNEDVEFRGDRRRLRQSLIDERTLVNSRQQKPTLSILTGGK